MKKLSLLGSTGSIGTQALETVSEFPDKFKVVGLTTNKNIELLKKQILYLLIGFVAMLGSMAIDYQKLRKIVKPLFVLAVVKIFLTVTKFPGVLRII